MTPNEMFLQLLENNGFNSCVGERIADDLREHFHLWEAVLFTGESGIILRDMAHDKVDYNADRLYIRTTEEHVGPLMELVSKWNTDSIFVMMSEKTLEFTRNERDELISKPAVYKESLSSFLGSYSRDPDTRVVFELWWD